MVPQLWATVGEGQTCQTKWNLKQEPVSLLYTQSVRPWVVSMSKPKSLRKTDAHPRDF